MNIFVAKLTLIRALPTGYEAALVNDGTFQRDRCCQLDKVVGPTFDLLAFLVADVLSHCHVITDQRTAASMLYRLLHRTCVLETVDSEPRPLSEVAILLLDGLDLNGVEGNKCRLSSSLIAHVLDTVDGDFFVVNDDSVDVAPQNGADGEIVFLLSGFAQVDDSSMDSWEDSLEAGEHLAKLDLALVLSFVRSSREEFAVNVLKLFVEFGLFDADIQPCFDGELT